MTGDSADAEGKLCKIIGPIVPATSNDEIKSVKTWTLVIGGILPAIDAGNLEDNDGNDDDDMLCSRTKEIVDIFIHTRLNRLGNQAL
ncbi:MAG TPA: hypothetical protein VJP79_09405 [Nitrososphaera sp.]|nr:hypothetical protein [Nitrososphaera sp.]